MTFSARSDVPVWIHRPISRAFARCDPQELARHVFEVVRGRALNLGFVDLDDTSDHTDASHPSA